MKTFTGNDFINYDIEGLFEVFNDILEAMGRPNFITGRKYTTFSDGHAELDYIIYGRQLKKIFNLYPTGTPEHVSDVQNWLFGLLDAAANI